MVEYLENRYTFTIESKHMNTYTMNKILSDVRNGKDVPQDLFIAAIQEKKERRARRAGGYKTILQHTIKTEENSESMVEQYRRIKEKHNGK